MAISEINICFMFVGLFIGAVITYVLSRAAPNLPYTVVVFVFGILLGLGVEYSDFGVLGESVDMWSLISPHLLLYIFLPALVFGDAMNLNIHHLSITFSSSVLMAGPGSVVGTLLLGACAKVMLPYDWSWNLCFTFGAILCATDTVAVVALLKQANAAPRLTMVVEQESLYNDGAALVLFNLFYDKLLIDPVLDFSTVDAVSYFIKVVFISPLVGMAFGFGTVIGLSYSNRRLNTNDVTIQVALTFCCAYLSFFVGEFLLHVSGVLCTCTAG